jgi:ribosomal protein S16
MRLPGRFIEKLGTYDPGHEPSSIELKEDRIQFWYERGAQLSPTVAKLLKIKNVKLASTPDPTKVTMASAGSQVTLTSTVTGLVVVTYEVATTTTRDVRRLVVLVE